MHPVQPSLPRAIDIKDQSTMKNPNIFIAGFITILPSFLI